LLFHIIRMISRVNCFQSIIAVQLYIHGDHRINSELHTGVVIIAKQSIPYCFLSSNRELSLSAFKRSLNGLISVSKTITLIVANFLTLVMGGIGWRNVTQSGVSSEQTYLLQATVPTKFPKVNRL